MCPSILYSLTIDLRKNEVEFFDYAIALYFQTLKQDVTIFLWKCS